MFTMSLLGERLRQTREGRGIAPLQVEMETRIRATVIEALEQGDYANLPPEPFLRGLIRTYANYLGLDADELLALYVADHTPPPPARPMPAPPTTSPEAPAPSASNAPTPATEPIRKPAAIRMPSLRPPLPRPPARKPNLPEPTAPPESLAPPETLMTATSNDTNGTSLRAHLTRRPAPLPVILAIIGGIVLVCLLAAIIAFTQVAPLLSEQTSTPTRPAPTRTATIRPGTIPTAIPTLAATALPLPTSRAPTATLKPGASAPDSTSPMTLDIIQVSQVITLQVGVDGVLVFSGAIAPGTTRSWSARDSLYVQIENPKGAVLELNGSAKWFAPRNFSETRALERQWELNAKGTPVPMVPVVPIAPPTPIAPLQLTPTPSR